MSWSRVSPKVKVAIGADFSGHVGADNKGDEEVMGIFGIHDSNAE